MDRILIDNLEVFGKHGVKPEENALGQKFLISCEMFLSIREAGKKDDLRYSVNYGDVSWMIKDFMEQNTFHLIETCAEGLAEMLLIRVPRVEMIRVEVKKPWAPVGLPLEAVSVTVERKRHTAFLSLGSNLGERKNNLEEGLRELLSYEGNELISCSKIYETAPWGKEDQPAFYNAAAGIRTLLEPGELLQMIHEAEEKLGRVREEHWGPRTLDIDILLYDDMVSGDPALTIPHPELRNRAFVLAPLSEIAPGLVLPDGKRETVRELAEKIQRDENQPAILQTVGELCV